MSFETFIEDIEEITTMPSPVKGEGGWFNPEDVQFKLFKCKDKIVYFDDTNADEIQLPLIEKIYTSIETAIAEDVREVISTSVEEGLKEISDEIKEITSRPVVTLAVVKKMVRDCIEENGGSVGNGPNKVKLSTLTMLKEEGYSVSEIAELRDAGLI